jgi:hypothetical protein
MTKQLVLAEQQFRNLKKFPFEFVKNLDSGSINHCAPASIVDWHCSGKCLLASHNFVYIVDRLDGPTTPSFDKLILGDRSHVITAVKWKDSTSSTNLTAEDSDLIWASAETLPQGTAEVRLWLGTKPLRRLNFEGKAKQVYSLEWF